MRQSKTTSLYHLDASIGTRVILRSFFTHILTSSSRLAEYCPDDVLEEEYCGVHAAVMAEQRNLRRTLTVSKG
nr:hypothetical transcript [Hymenolepis microstoma]